MFNWSRLALGTPLATTSPGDECRNRDAIFDCGTTTVGAKGETDILVEGGWSGNVTTFHAYPIIEEGTQAVSILRLYGNPKRDFIEISGWRG